MNAPSSTPALDPGAIDTALRELDAKKTEWARMDVREKAQLIDEVIGRVNDHAAAWVGEAIQAKGIEGTSLAGEEWMSGPWALIAGLSGLRRTLERIAEGVPPYDGHPVHRRQGHVVVEVFPSNPYERLLLSGFRAEVWMQPDVTEATLREHTASFYREKDPAGGVSCVLGAGNIASIPPLDLMYELVAHGYVTICKLNPVNGYLGPVFERIFEPLIDRGFVRFVQGGGDVGGYLVHHELVGKVHITGSGKTHDAIVFGAGPEGAERKARREPILQKPITSELGGVGGVIVVPGKWSDADLRYQAEHVATMKLHNGGFNCIAAQTLILHEEWPQKARFLELIQEAIAKQRPRPAYYPGAEDRQKAAVEAHSKHTLLGGDVPRTRLRKVPSTESAYAFREEFFAPVYAETSLSAPDAASFLRRAVHFANDRLYGTLGVQLLVHPKTARRMKGVLEDAIADLRFGTVGVNAWSGVGFFLPFAHWGAYPGHTLADVQSGIGVVHNAMLFDKSEKTVVHGPFAPFPRAALLGEAHTSPKPPWFVTHAKADVVGQLLTRFEAAPSPAKLPAIFAAALRG